MAGATGNCWHHGTLWEHHTTMRRVTSCKATYVRCMYVLVVTCHLHFWQNDRDLLRATAVTRGWNGYRNKSQHRKLTLEKKILPPFLQGFESATFRSRVRRSNHWAIPASKQSQEEVVAKRILNVVNMVKISDAASTLSWYRLQACENTIQLKFREHIAKFRPPSLPV